MPQAELDEAFRFAIEERLDAELLREPSQLAKRCGAFLQIDEVCLDPAFGEEPKRLARVGVFLDAEYLDFHEPCGRYVALSEQVAARRGTAVERESLAESDDPKFSPAWWVRGPHAQTLWSQFFRRRLAPALREERLTTPDGDHLYLYHHDLGVGRPRVLLLHGLEGSSNSHYVSGIVSKAARRGWSTTVLVFRGCGPELNSAPRMYHSGETTDLRFVVDLLIDRAPRDRLFLTGVSLGGNVVLKFLGEAASRTPSQIRAAAAVSVPYDLEAGCRALQQGFARMYDRHFLKSLRRKALRKLAQHPDLFDLEKLTAARTIEDFDDAVTGPIHGFTGSHDYYTRSSSIAFLAPIHVPTLLLSAEDDPFLPRSVLKKVRDIARANPKLQVHFTEAGGHVGFLGGHIPFRPVYWGEERIMAFFDSQSEEPPDASAVS